MPFALGIAAIVIVLVAPLVLAVRIALAQVKLDSAAERWLLSMLVVPVVLIAEVLGLSLLPVERPLRLLMPWAHLAVLALCAAWLWARRVQAGAQMRNDTHRVGRIWRSLDPATRVATLTAAATLTLAIVHGAWNTGDEHDGALYRMLVAVQPFQDGRVGRVEFAWDHYADAYPRTAELIYSWTMLCTRTTVGFHLVNWYFLLVLAMAAFAAARRAGTGLRPAVLCAALTATTPLPIYLTGILYSDVPACAAVGAAVAFALPPRRRGGAWGGPWGGGDLAAFAVAASVGASMKLSAAIPVALVAGLRLGFIAWRGRRDGGASALTTAAVLLLAAAVASVQFVRSWIVYGSPVWPVRLEVAGVVVFEGPMAAQQLWITAKGDWFGRWWTAIYKLFQTTSQDANGSLGLAFAIGVVPAAVVFAVWCVRRPTFARVLLTASFWYVVLVPVSTNLRYSMHVLVPGYIMLALVIQRARRSRRLGAAGPILALLVAINAADYARTVVREVAEQLRAGVSLIDPERNRMWYMRFMYVEPGIAPEMHRVVHGLVRPGERLVYAVRCLGGLLYDPWFSYAIEYRSIEYSAQRRGVRTGNPTAARAWLDSLHQDGIAAVLVYTGSPEDEALAAPGSGFALVYDRTDGPPRWRVRVYRSGPR